jgi:urea transport system substrate-binding protein
MVKLWAAAVEKAGSFDVDAVKEAADGIEIDAPGGKVVFDGENQHVYKTVRIGEIQADGQFQEVWNSGEPVKPDPFLEGYDWANEISSAVQ